MSKSGKAVAVLGTASDVGKSIVATALCRIFVQDGFSVAPFKAQNMSNNAGVVPGQGEMARAQIVQAGAAKVRPHVDMNPVLLKPVTDQGSQVVLHGKVIGNREARAYFGNTSELAARASASLNRLLSNHDLVVMEGAGSCAEVNLRRTDFVNFRMAHEADCPVVLVADIDRGGVFAQVVGTLEVLPPEDRARVAAIIVNRFRGDMSLFEDGRDWLEQRTGLPVLGVVPFFRHIHIESEDGLPPTLTVDPPERPDPDKINVAVPRLPHIANFTDFDPLVLHERVQLHYLAKPRDLSGYQLVLLPGSKSVQADLAWLREQGWDRLLQEHVARGGFLGGICGGYQMLGEWVEDPQGIEGPAGGIDGLGYLPLRSRLEPEKIVREAEGVWLANGQSVSGYEIHMGRTEFTREHARAITILRRDGAEASADDGCISADGRIWGCYLHGLFDEPGFTAALLQQIDSRQVIAPSDHATARREQQYELLAEHFRAHLDIQRLKSIIGL